MSGKGWQGNYFEDFTLGTRLDCPPDRTVTAGDAAAYIALTGDRTAAFCGASQQAHPLVVFHTVFGQTVRPISLNARANLGYAGIRWGAPEAHFWVGRCKRQEGDREAEQQFFERALQLAPGYVAAQRALGR